MLFHGVSKKHMHPSGSDTNNSENHGNWGCRCKLRIGRGSLKPIVIGRNKTRIRGEREPNTQGAVGSAGRCPRRRKVQ